MEDFFLFTFIKQTLNPQSIYEGFTYISSLAAFFPWLYVVFISMRLYRESLNALSLKASMFKVLTDSSKTLLVYSAYTIGGVLIFGVMFAVSSLFEGFGSAGMIHSEMLELRNILINSEKEYEGWFEIVLTGASEIGNIFAAGLTFALYGSVSVAYVFLTQFIDVLFSIGIVCIYAWGFIAIATIQLGEKQKLTGGWYRSAMGLFIWLIIEPILIGLMWLLAKAGKIVLINSFAGVGVGTTAITMWYVYAILMMILIIIMKVLAPFIALMLARNDSVVGALGAAAAGMSMIAANHLSRDFVQEKGKVDNLKNSIMPDLEGGRKRDSVSRGVNDILNSPLSELKNRMFGGSGNSESPGNTENPTNMKSNNDQAGGGPENKDNSNNDLSNSKQSTNSNKSTSFNNDLTSLDSQEQADDSPDDENK